MRAGGAPKSTTADERAATGPGVPPGDARPAAALEQVARALVALLLFAAPLLLGYPRPGGYHWLEKLSSLLTTYEFPLLAAHLWVCLAALLVLFAAGLRRQFGARLDLVGMGAVAFLLATGLATARSVSPHASLIELTRIFDAVAVYFLVRRLCGSPSHRLLFLGALVAGAAVVAAYSLRHYVWTAAIGKDATWREFGSFGNPNSLAGYLLVVLPVGVGLLLAAGGRSRRGGSTSAWRLVLGFAVVLMLGALFVTGSKGGILAFLLSMLAFAALVAWPWARGSPRRKLALVSLCLLPIVLGLLLPQVRGRFLVAFTTESHSGAFRLYTWLGTWHMFLARPWLGWGPGSFADVFPQFAIAGFTRLAHNKDLQVAAEGGLVSFVPLAFLFIAYLLRSLAAALRAESIAERAIPAGLFSAVLGFSLHSLVDYDWYIPAICLVVWAVIGLPLADQAPPETSQKLSRGARKALRREKRGQQVESREARPRLALQAAFLGLVTVIIASLVAFGALELGSTIHLRTAWNVMWQRADDTVAASELERAASLSPLNPEPPFRLGLIHERPGSKKDLAAARAPFERVCALEPTVPRAYVRLSVVAGALGDSQGAIKLAEEAWKRAPRDSELIAKLARLYLLAKRDADAERMYRWLNELWDSPARKYPAIEGMVDWRYAWAWIYFYEQARQRGDEGEAQRWLKRALDLLDEYQAYMEKQRPMLEPILGRWPPPDLDIARELWRGLGGELRQKDSARQGAKGR